MDFLPLVREEIDAGAELIKRLGADQTPVRVAFWLKPTDEPRWYLYLAADWVPHRSSTAGYKVVQKIVRAMDNEYLDLFKTKVISMNDPLTIAAQQFHQDYPSKSPSWYGNSEFGSELVDKVYLYPTELLEASTKPSVAASVK